jgi:hypothetical protein
MRHKEQGMLKIMKEFDWKFFLWQIQSLWFLIKAFSYALCDLLFTFFPILVLMFCFYLRDGDTQKIASSSDLVFLVATLYAEGVWRSIKTEFSEYLVPLGLIGAVLSSVMASLLVLHTEKYSNNSYFLNALALLYLFAILYALIVRMLSILRERMPDKPKPPA